MAKMLMGQINHARQRVKELAAEKSGPTPESMSLSDAETLLKQLRNGTIAVTKAQICTAFDAFVNGTKVNAAKVETGSYRNNYETTHSLRERKATSVEDALASVVFKKSNSKEAQRYASELELYRLRAEGVKIRAQAVEDAIVLGDQQAALIALREFAAWEF